jgi:phosphate transport system substrate-binding protein
MKTLLIALLITVCASGAAAAGDKITVAGSGGMIPLATRLADGFMAKYPGEVVEVSQTSIESTGGIRSAEAGRIDIGMSARPLEAREMSGGLKQTEIARAALVVGVNKNVPITGLSEEEVCRIYKGEITNWAKVGGNNASILVFTRPDADSTKKTVREHMPCFASLVETQSAVIMPKSADMVKAVMSRPDSIGLLDAVGAFDSKGAIRPLKLNGVSPDEETIASGRYRIVKRFFFVTRPSASATVDKFIGFIKSKEGAAIIKASHAMPIP